MGNGKGGIGEVERDVEIGGLWKRVKEGKGGGMQRLVRKNGEINILEKFGDKYDKINMALFR